MNKILEFKHWHLFLLIFLLPYYFFQKVLMSFANKAQIFGMDASQFVWLSVCIFLLSSFLYYFWIWQIAKKGNQIIAPELRSSLNVFEFFVILRVSFFAFAGVILLFIFTDLSFDLDIPNTWNLSIVIGILVWKLFSFFGVLYTAAFSAKTIKKVELDRPVAFDECLGLFLGFLFFPIGIWFIQSKVNRFIKINDEPILEEFV